MTVVHHGVPDPFADAPGDKERMAMTVGAIDSGTLVQKGQLPFVQAARELPDVRFVFSGKWLDDSVERLRDEAGGRVEFTGWVSDDELHALYRRAAVYVQASRHEGFGLAVAFTTTGTHPASMASATARPNPSWREACT